MGLTVEQTTTGREAIARDPAALFARKGETLQEQHRCCTERALGWGPYFGFVGKGGDATLLIHEGLKAQEEFEKSGKVPDPSSTGVKTLDQMQANGTLLFPAINVNDSVTKIKFHDLYGYYHPLRNGLMRATDLMIAGKVVAVCGHGDFGKVHAATLQAHMEGLEVLTAEDVLPEPDIFVTATGNKDIIMNLGCATGHPSRVMSCAFTNQVIAQLVLWKENAGKYEKKVYVLPKHLDEKVPALYLGKLGAKLTILTKDQADYG